MRTHFLILVVAGVFVGSAVQQSNEERTAPAVHSEKKASEKNVPLSDKPVRTIESAVRPPQGFERIDVEQGSFGLWLRDLAVRAGRPAVFLYDGRRKANQSVHYAVLDIDVGSKDLQQCADAVIRLRAEYLFSGSCRDDIRFNFSSGDTARWTEWRDGLRPTVSENSVSWARSAGVDSGYGNFRLYLETVFIYAGSASLELELASVTNPESVEIGDVFIKGGFPGHAVLVVDVAKNDADERVFLLAQSYMPAQDIHILKSYEDINPWYRAKSTGVLDTPEWGFGYADLKRFANVNCATSENGSP